MKSSRGESSMCSKPRSATRPGSSSSGVERNMYGSRAIFIGRPFVVGVVRCRARACRRARSRPGRRRRAPRRRRRRPTCAAYPSQALGPVAPSPAVTAAIHSWNSTSYAAMKRSRQSFGHRDADPAGAAHHDRAAVGQRGGAGLADHLAADVVAVADVDRRLDVDQHAGLASRRIISSGSWSSPPRLLGLAASTRIAASSSPSSHRVTSKSCTAVSTIAMSLRVVGGHRGVAVTGVVHQRSADLAGVDDLP